MSSLYRGVKDGEIIGIIAEKKHINGLEINFASGIDIDLALQQRLNTENQMSSHDNK